MYQLPLKITLVSIILFYNSLSHAMLVSTKHRRAQSTVNYYKCICEDIYIKAITNNIPLNKALTKKQLLILTDHFFDKSLPQSPLECKSLQEEDKTSRQEINLLQKKRLSIFKALPEDIAQEKIVNQFQQIKKRLLDDEYLARQNLVTVYAQEYNFDVKNIPPYEHSQLEVKNLLKKKYNNIIHDKTLPQKWVECVQNAMTKKNLDINNINLSIEEDPETFASCTSPNSITPGRISLNVLFTDNHCTENYIDDLIFAANHEVTHLYSGHTIIRVNTIVSIIDQIQESKKVIFNTDTYNDLCKEINDNSPAGISFLLAQERFADTLFTLEDPESAYSASLFPHLYSGSYNYIALAHTNWKALRILIQHS